jgi:GntR family transcriptional regulator, vanillate catabolism transcriptional regulator
MALTTDDSIEVPGDPLRLAPRARIVDEVHHKLRESILNHSIPPGARLVQLELASRLGVSRTPLREAIRLLEQDGLVRVSDGNRTVEVVRLSRQELADLYAIREVIDGLAARTMAANGAHDDTKDVLASCVETMRSSAEPFRGHDFFVAHVRFHSTIIERCGNGRLASQLSLVRLTAASLRDSFPRFVTESRWVTAKDARQTARIAHQEHLRIFEAIDRQDPDGAERAARVHIANAARYFPADEPVSG